MYAIKVAGNLVPALCFSEKYRALEKALDPMLLFVNLILPVSTMLPSSKAVLKILSARDDNKNVYRFLR